MVKHLHSKCEALSSKPSTAKKKRKIRTLSDFTHYKNTTSLSDSTLLTTFILTKEL
jgi:hypothetical protein